eukprot:gnl/TRDRNA2_/TRDRNA2_175726_c0_seq72.p1 gnl/TRDRNA2_/TRDRNA2_175726_c0~~gnl/TRDRNA2_/TRDRNA2_175726_c0_seq72.p1  ORF type:complete len:786 (+),score=294.58 gnl/TRDRNA2_/TRDRNA2_175726_c0_seq72:97-2358(+)
MKLFVAIAFLLAAHAAHASVQTTVTKDSTITKVVKILETMMEKSKKEGAKEATLFGKYQCYCDTNEAEKTASITDLTKKIGLLGSNIQELQGANGKLSAECAELRTAMQDNEAAREEAQGIRDKAEAAFLAEEADLKQAIGQMDDAITTLAEVGADQTAKLVQLGNSGGDHAQFRGSASLVKLSDTVKHALSAASVFLDSRQSRSVESFLQAPFTGTYTSQSAEIVGILKNMRDTFKQNLANARATEDAQSKAFKKFMKTKNEEYDMMKEEYEEKQENLGTNDDELSAKKTQLDDAESTKADDEEFLAKLITMCDAKAKQYEERTALRANEDAAISEAIAILNSDAAFGTFQKSSATSTGATGFLQMSSRRHRIKAAAVMSSALKQAQPAMEVLKKAHSKRLGKIVAMLQKENPFDGVLEEIKKMLVLIEEEAAADKENLDWCNQEREENHDSLDKAKKSIETLESEISDLDSAINDPVEGLLKQISDTETALEENTASQIEETKERTKENLQYQGAIKNLVAAEDILDKAIKALKKFYDALEEKYADELLQSTGKEEPAPPDTFDDEYKGQSSKGGDAIEMLEFILKETKKEETEAHTDEKDAQHDYEDSMTELKKQEADDQETLASLNKELAETKEELLMKKEELAKTEKEKKRLEDYLEDIKPGCDFITENYEDREESREVESKALKKASGLIKDTPIYKSLKAAEKEDSWGECKDICKEAGEDHVKCKACLADVTIPGYCAGHKDTEGC